MFLIKSTVIYTIFFLFLMLIFLLYVLGAARYITDFEENTCDMTYMFEYPQYVVCKQYDDLKKKLLLLFTC